MGMGPCVLASGSNQVLASISVIKKGTSLHPSHEPVLTSTRVPSSSLFHQKVGRAKQKVLRLSDLVLIDLAMPHGYASFHVLDVWGNRAFLSDEKDKLVLCEMTLE